MEYFLLLLLQKIRYHLKLTLSTLNSRQCISSHLTFLRHHSLFLFCLFCQLLLPFCLLLQSFKLRHLSLLFCFVLIEFRLKLVQRHVAGWSLIELLYGWLLKLLWWMELFWLLLVVELLLLLLMELFLWWLKSILLIHGWSLELLMAIKINILLLFLWRSEMLSDSLLLLPFSLFLPELIRLPAVLVPHARLHGSSYHFFFLVLLLLSLLIKHLTFLERSLHEGLLLCTLSFLSDSQRILQIFIL